MVYGRRTEKTMSGEYHVQDVASGIEPIEYFAKPIDDFGPGAQYETTDRWGETTISTVPDLYDGPATSWDTWFLDDDD